MGDSCTFPREDELGNGLQCNHTIKKGTKCHPAIYIKSSRRPVLLSDFRVTNQKPPCHPRKTPIHGSLPLPNHHTHSGPAKPHSDKVSEAPADLRSLPIQSKVLRIRKRLLLVDHEAKSTWTAAQPRLSEWRAKNLSPSPRY